MDIQEPVLFLRSYLHKGLYCGHKGKRYTIEVVITAEKLLLNNLKDIKDSLGEAQNQQDSNKDKKQKVTLKKVLKLEKD